MITTTLNKIRKHSPCEDGWVKLNKFLGSDYGKDASVKFSQILESNGLDDALWCLRSICPEHEKEVRLFAVDCAERVLPIYEKKYPNDSRVRDCIEATKKYLNDEITLEELRVFRVAAYAAAYAADADAYAAADAAAVAAENDAAYAAYAAAVAAAADAAAYARKKEREAQAKMLIERFG